MVLGMKLSEIIRRAGGVKPDASLDEARLIRKVAAEMADPEYERLKKMPVADMSKEEYQYFKTKSREHSGVVVVDFRRLLIQGDPEEDIILREGDIIQIPKAKKVVNVSG